MNSWTCIAASFWFECPTKLGILVQLYFISIHIGMVMRSHLAYWCRPSKGDKVRCPGKYQQTTQNNKIQCIFLSISDKKNHINYIKIVTFLHQTLINWKYLSDTCFKVYLFVYRHWTSITLSVSRVSDRSTVNIDQL